MSPDTTTTESSDEEWEEVEESQKYKEEKDVVPTQNVEVELVPEAMKKKLKREKWDREMIETCIRQAAKRIDKEMQIVMHKVHLLCLLSMRIKVNRLCNDEELLSITYSLLPEKYHDVKPKHVSAMFFTRFIQDFTKVFETEKGAEKLLGCGMLRLAYLEQKLKEALESHKVKYKLDWVLIFTLALRAMGLNTRLVVSLQPLPLKASVEQRNESVAALKSKIYASPPKAKSKKRPLVVDKEEKEIPQFDGANDPPVKRRVTRSTVNVKSKENVDNNNTETKHVKRKKLAKKDSNEENTLPLMLGNKKQARNETEVELKQEPKVTRKRGKSNNNKEEIQKDVKDESNKKQIRSRMNKKQKGGVAKVGNNTNEADNNSPKQEVKEDNKIEETPLVKPLTNSKTKRKLRTNVKRKINVKKEDNSDCDDEDDDFKPVKSSSSDSEDNSDSDFEVEKKKSPSPPKKARLNLQGSATTSKKLTIKGKSKTQAKKTTSRRGSAPKKVVNSSECFDEWIEVYSEEENKWICLDVFRGVINHPEQMEKYSTPPLHYVIGLDNNNFIKDITPRYAAKWLTDTRKLRIGNFDKEWWKETLSLYATTDTDLDAKENRQMQESLLAQPMPTTISAFKNHPLFGLRRHLLKYEALYPADVPSVGLIRGEEVFPRSAIHVLHTREKWLQQAKSVKEGEKPYKMVASAFVNMKLKQDMATLSMPLFGVWQTEPYIPQTASNGKVPKNQFGNVDLFMPEMLPFGCVQLRLPGLNRVARKLNIDVATAIIGFDTHNGYPHPVTDGYIACIEHADMLEEAWKEDQLHAAEREREKREKRVYGHWKFFIKAMLAKERVKRKYAYLGTIDKNEGSTDANSNETPVRIESGAAWQNERMEVARRMSKHMKRRKLPIGIQKEELFPV